MSFDLEKLQAVAELGEVIRLQNEAMDRLKAFRQARPYLIMPNLAKMVEENMKENVQVLYKELNNLHKPADQQTRYICDDCKMAFLVKLPGGICDECRANRATKPREYVVNAPPVDPNAPDEDLAPGEPAQAAEEAPAPVDPSDFAQETSDISVAATSEGVPLDAESTEDIAADVVHAAEGDKLPVEEEAALTGAEPADVSGSDSQVVTQANAAAEGDAAAAEEMSDEFMKFMNAAGAEPVGQAADTDPRDNQPQQTEKTDIFTETDLNVASESEENRENR